MSKTARICTVGREGRNKRLRQFALLPKYRCLIRQVSPAEVVRDLPRPLRRPAQDQAIDKNADLSELRVAWHHIGHTSVSGPSHDPRRDLLDGSAYKVHLYGICSGDPREKFWHPEIISV